MDGYIVNENENLGDYMNDKKIMLQTKKIRKEFGPTVAVNDVDMTVYKGEVRGLIGENGSGKSTIASLIAGMLKPNSGEMYFKDQLHQPDSMIEGSDLGIGMIVQEKGTIDGITVAQNIFLGKEDIFNKYGFINKKAMNKAAKESLESVGVNNVEPYWYIDRLDMQQRKLVEIAKVMNNNPDIFIVDETTTALSHEGRTILYNLIKKVKERNKTVLFISHDLDEIMEQCDTLTVLRDGQYIDTLDKKDFNEDRIKQLMVGREMSNKYYRNDQKCSFDDEVVIRVNNLTTGHGLTKNVSFNLHKGEILGIAGLSHCGMHELGRAIFGSEKIVTGEVIHKPSNTSITNSRVAIKNNMGYVSKDRDLEALILNASIEENIVGAAYDIVNDFGVITPKSEKTYVNKQIDALSIKCSSAKQQVKFLSGGNKQKVVFAKWLGRESETMILDCPTRGIDIGVKAAMYDLMERMKKDKKSILMISEELSELLGMCDRVLIMKDGEIKKEIYRDRGFDEHVVIKYMI